MIPCRLAVHRVRRPDDAGQSTVELALTVPLLMLLLLGAVQVAIVIRGQLTVVHAAREGARAAAVAAASGSAAEAAVRDAVASGDLRRVHVSTATGSTSVHVTVRAIVPTDVPLIGFMVGDVTVNGSATMAVEP